jgi:hypothetical protein
MAIFRQLTSLSSQRTLQSVHLLTMNKQLQAIFARLRANKAPQKKSIALWSDPVVYFHRLPNAHY